MKYLNDLVGVFLNSNYLGLVCLCVVVFFVFWFIFSVKHYLKMNKIYKKIIKEKTQKVELNRDILAYENEPKKIDVISCVEEGATSYLGYLDLSYLRSLIEKLKNTKLEFDEEKYLEEFEVYLLNFVNRQPRGEERVQLSEYIGKLIKTLAKYEIA